MEELDDREFRQKVVAKKVTQSGDRDSNLWAKFFVNSAPLVCISDPTIVHQNVLMTTARAKAMERCT